LAKSNSWYIYRDTLNGKFAKKSTWKRSKGQGGNRYKRQRVKRKKEEEPPPPIGDVFEWIVGFEYGKTGRSFDVITTARNETEAYEVAKEFLSDQEQGRRIVRAGFSGWNVDVARGHKSDEEAGEAEYRDKSKRGRK